MDLLLICSNLDNLTSSEFSRLDFRFAQNESYVLGPVSGILTYSFMFMSIKMLHVYALGPTNQRQPDASKRHN